MFDAVPANVQFPKLEQQVLAFWKERGIFEKSLAQRSGGPPFVFYEGPPTANGMPHPGHCLTRAIKDLFPRYRTMRGYDCRRKAGWDTHGLPVEVEVCKELGIHSKEEIEAYGVEPFIHRCQESVWRYMKEWERLTERLGFWIHLGEAYVTYHQSYVESVWWSLKTLFDRGLLYQGHKIVWWWAQGGTALSAGEVGQGYREVADPSVYVRFPLLDEKGNKTDISLLVWTTTPWTLPSNQFVAVHPDLEYSTVVDSESGERLILASALVEAVAQKVKRELKVETTLRGDSLLHRRYVPPFDDYYRTMNDARASLKSGDDEYLMWRVVPADFVTIDSGTGVVHQAPAFGEVDFEVLKTENARFADASAIDLLNAVAPDGTFTDEGPDFCRGRWVKDCDKEIVRDLKNRGLLFHQEQYIHDYPFCWRAEEDPLIQYPRRSWFIRTTAFKDRMLENNSRINWLPEHIKSGRFGNFLETNVDWALSRERYWGTPLPIWQCQACGQMEAIGSYDELLAKKGVQGTEAWLAAKKQNPKLPDDLKVHKPYIDEVTYASTCPGCADESMRRVSEVIDCWYDAGAMPFAQWGYRGEDGPKDAVGHFHDQFPADFISEALDQTRGWFYSLLAISTLLFSDQSPAANVDEHGRARTNTDVPRSPAQPYPHPYRNCVVLGLMLGEDGGKMSKSKRNYREPQEIFDRYGADALRWFFFANQPPWTTIRYSEKAIKESIPEFLLRLWNVYSFLVIYANIDGFDPASSVVSSQLSVAKTAESKPQRTTDHGQRTTPLQLCIEDFQHASTYRPASQRGELDRWITSELHRMVAGTIERMDAYDNYTACVRINEFVDALSNWYVRRSRDRFWSAEKNAPDKLDAYWTLYECLVTTTKVIAPFVPFLSETLWQNLAGVFGDRAVESVHLCDFPVPDTAAIDETLSRRMSLVREIASLGRSARMESKLKVRQPLARVEVILVDPEQQAWLEEHDALLRDELNVKTIEYASHAEQYIDYHVQPNFPRLGPRLGKLLPHVKKALAEADGGAVMAQLRDGGRYTLKLGQERVELDSEDVQVRLQAKPGWAAAQGRQCVVVLSTELTPELLREGMANDVVRLIQERRKELQLEYTDRIAVGIVTDSEELTAAFDENRDYIMQETLATSLTDKPIPTAEGADHEISGHKLTLYVSRSATGAS